MLVYGLIGGAFAAGYFRWDRVDMAKLLRHNWLWGVIAAGVVGAFTVNNILSQPASARADGGRLVFDIPSAKDALHRRRGCGHRQPRDHAAAGPTA